MDYNVRLRAYCYRKVLKGRLRLCLKKLRKSLLFWVLVLFLLPSHCFSEVVLTDEEAKEMLQEMEASEEELTKLRKHSDYLEKKLTSLEDISKEQSQSYKEQLSEAKKNNATAWTVAGMSTVINVLLCVVLIVAL